ncbi:RHS repeat domain-containing protein [Tenacibaculum maritimum]|uniref:RHS repeat domain-containing protein n=1 Tax=Tenacibaculum maritimum TaxID=107401 RepID=UPI00142D7FDA|nr:RHS repeat-associated core domain-containing protein [Tenacibaculum maritimum]
MYDEGGEQVWERSLDLNGKVINGSNAPCPFLYQGQYYDKEIELAYNRFRYYDPDDGRYISKDPIGLLGNNPNLYAYVKDSNTWVDVFGLDCSKKGKATIRQFHGEGRAGHFSIEIEFNGKKLHTHQVITSPDKSSTRIVDADIYSPSSKLANSKTIEIPNAENAMVKQKDLMNKGDLGLYIETENSCLTHVADVMEAGGNSPVLRNERGLFVFAKRLGFGGL